MPDVGDREREIITCGKVSHAVWFVAWPTVVNTLIQTAYNLINRLFLGGLPDSDKAQAALGIGWSVLNIEFCLISGMSAGTAALVARFIGAREDENAVEATRQSLILATAAGILCSIPLVVWAEPLVRGVGAAADVAKLAAPYLAIIGGFSILPFLHMVVMVALRSAGDVRHPLYAGAVMIGVNTLLDWLLILGPGPLPSYGVTGAAVATVASRFVGTALILVYLYRSKLRDSLSHFKPHFGWFGRVMNIGWPATIQGVLWGIGFIAYIRIMSYLPNATAAQAALTVGLSIEAICYMPGVAYSTAATPLVGQNLGAGQPDRAQRCSWVASWHAAAIMTGVAVLFLAIPHYLAAPFTDNKEVLALIVSYLRVAAPSEPFLAVGMVLAGALQGAGDTRMPTVIEFLVNWPIRLTLAWLLTFVVGMGALGAWVAMTASTIIYGLMIVAWFKTGRWKTVKV